MLTERQERARAAGSRSKSHPRRVQLCLKQLVEEGVRRHLLAHGLAQHMVEMLGGMPTSDRDKPLARGIDVELGLGRARRATSANAA